MCGFAAFIATEKLSDERVGQVSSGMVCQRHRGPDDTRTWNDDRTCFGFNRLSIIDIEGSSQPLFWGPTDQPDRYVMVFNGEIYNYVELREQLIAEGAQFHTSGDGEPVIAGYHLHGAAWVEQLRGMFSFVIWDTVDKVAFGARDWFGIKPLYVATFDDGIGFSSEAKTLREMTGPGVVDKLALQHYLVLQYVPEPESADANLRRIESGTSFEVRDGVLSTHRYFHPVFDAVPVSGAQETTELEDRILAVLDDSVAKHMRADVTVGSFLSGGIDSTAIAALAKRYNPDLLTFTTGFEREGYSEVDVAAESAAAIGVAHHVKIVSQEELFETLPLIVWYLDDPVADPALVPLYFVAREARKHVKVVLSGEGADELFGGYNIYREPISLAPLTRLPNPLRRGLGAISRVLPQGMRGKSLLERGTIDLEQRYYGNARHFTDAQIRQVMPAADPAVSFRDVTDPVYALSKDWDPVARMQHIDLFTWLRGDILVKADRVTMANSLELRVPFMDKEVFEVARHIALEQKITSDQSKVALRNALAKVVPAHVLNRRKLGFPVPVRVYLTEDYGYSWAADLINRTDAGEFIDKAAALRLLDAHKAGQGDYSRQIWTLLVFMLWHDIFVTGRIAPEVPHPQYPVEL